MTAQTPFVKLSDAAAIVFSGATSLESNYAEVMTMSLCQEGLDCVWGRKYENTIICSMPHCPMVRLRSGNVDKLRREFIAHAKQGPEIVDFDVDAMMNATAGENDAGDGSV